MVQRCDDLAGQQERHPRPQAVRHLGDGGGRDPLVRAEPGAGDDEGRAAHHDVGEAVDDGAEVTADGEEGGLTWLTNIQSQVSARLQNI